MDIPRHMRMHGTALLTVLRAGGYEDIALIVIYFLLNYYYYVRDCVKKDNCFW